MRKFLSFLAVAVLLALVPVVHAADATVSIIMDLCKDLPQLVADAKYDSVNPDVATNFCVPVKCGTRATKVHLLHYPKRMTSTMVLADMKRQGFRPATFQELLWIGIQHPLLQRDFVIAALDASVKIHHGRRGAAFLGGITHRGLSLYWEKSNWPDDWDSSCRFAAVRK